MKYIYIESCTDPTKWYANCIGMVVPLIDDCGEEYKTRDPVEGYLNFIEKQDCYIVDD